MSSGNYKCQGCAAPLPKQVAGQALTCEFCGVTQAHPQTIPQAPREGSQNLFDAVRSRIEARAQALHNTLSQTEDSAGATSTTWTSTTTTSSDGGHTSHTTKIIRTTHGSREAQASSLFNSEFVTSARGRTNKWWIVLFCLVCMVPVVIKVVMKIGRL